MFSVKKLPLLSALLAISTSLVLIVFSIWFGDLNQDEGWYLYAAKMVSQGCLPYRDFFFTQGPTLPAVYGWTYDLWSWAGVLGGRVFTALIGFFAALLTGLLASRSVSREKALPVGIVAFALVACNLYHVYFTVIPKTYALASFLLAASFLLLTFCDGTKRSMLIAFAAGAIAAFAGGARVSLLFALPPVAFALLFYRRFLGWAWFFFGVGAVTGVAVTFGWTFFLAPEEFLFSQTFHIGRGGRNLMFVAGSISRTVRAYTALFGMGLFALCFRFATGRRDEGEVQTSPRAFHRIIWLLASGSVVLVQLTSPHPYDDYQVPVMGILGASLAAWAFDMINAKKSVSWAAFFAVVFVCMVSFGSSMIQDWFVVRQDRFWTVMAKGSAISNLRTAASEIRKLAPKGGVLLTQDAYLAIEARMDLPPGMEMGPFSYFPDLSDAEASKNHVLNTGLLKRALETVDAMACAFSEYSWAIKSPSTDPVPEEERKMYLDLIDKRFEEVFQMADFGQNHTKLTICGRKHGN